MTSNGIIIDSILYTQTIIGFILIGCLILLVKTTKLTYIDGFRQKLVSGLYVFLGAISIFFIVRYYVGLTADYNSILLSIVSVIGVFFVLLTMLGILKLKEYISSLIDFKQKNLVIFSFLIGASLSIILNFIKIILQPEIISTFSSILFYLLIFPILMGVFYFSAFYCFFLHREIKTIKINIMVYFGFGFLCIAFISVPSMFFDIKYDIIYWIIINFCLVGLIVFFIFGYLNFKNRIKNLKIQ
ncbi:MAG: hypothetical protein ACFFCM_16155 [Promethearchaeota archaeon]